MKRILIISCLTCIFYISYAQQDTIKGKEIVKKGWSLGALPVVAFNSDLGFQYGALANLFNFGDGSRYPNYNESIYAEWSRTTKGSGINKLSYDTKTLIKNTRLTAELNYSTEQALDFYGFNGYEAYYNQNYEDESTGDYRSRMFYRIDRKRFLFKSDFQINIIHEKLRALVGLSLENLKISEVDIDKLNKGLSNEDKLPSHDEQPGLYKYYTEAGLITKEDASGGFNGLLKLGAVYDTRDTEANPNKGIWAESFILTNPGFNDNSYAKLIVNWHQYQTIIPRKINFAYRLSYQPKIWGDIPWYMLPNIYNTRSEKYGLGGYYSLRGILRNRVVGDGMAYANFEFRTVFFRTVVKKQNFYLGFVPFVDMGMVTQKTKVDYSLLPAEVSSVIQPQTDKEKLHTSLGAELKFVLNDNFIVSTSYGKAMDKRDGTSGFYIALDYLF